MRKRVLGLILTGMGNAALAAQTSPVDINALMQQYRHVQTAPQVLSAERNTILIFVSFSMPEASLKQWMRDANKVGAPVVLRGFVNNSFKQTAADLQTVLGSQHGGVQIDPPSFEKYHITQVPAVVMTTNTGDFDVVYGNASLNDVLDVFIREGQPDVQANARQLQPLLEGNTV